MTVISLAGANLPSAITLAGGEPGGFSRRDHVALLPGELLASR